MTSVRGGWEELPSCYACTAHTPTLSQTASGAILGPSKDHLNETKDQSLSDPTSYATSTAHSKTSQKATSHTRWPRKFHSKNLTLGNNHTHKIPLRIKDSRTTRLKQHLKALMQKLGHRKKIVSERLKLQITRLGHLSHTIPNATLCVSLGKWDLLIYTEKHFRIFSSTQENPIGISSMQENPIGISFSRHKKTPSASPLWEN
jgi:hypothetical protein